MSIYNFPTSPVDGEQHDTGTGTIYEYVDGVGWEVLISASGSVRKEYEFISTASQSVFTGMEYQVGYVDVFVEGVKLVAGTDFTATDGTTITLTSPISAGLDVQVVASGVFSNADHYTKTEVDNTPSGFKNLLINGGFDVWQRGDSRASTGFSTDRWWSWMSPTTNISKGLSAETGSYMHINYTSGDVFSLGNRLEVGLGDLIKYSNKPYTFSWEAYMSFEQLDVAWSIVLRNTDATEVTLASGFKDYGASTLEKHSTAITFPDLSGYVDVTSIEFRVFHDLSGNNVSSQAIGVYNAQLEEGSVATPFEQRPYGLELSLCQRYYRIINFARTQVIVYTPNGDTRGGILQFPNMRVAPSATWIAGEFNAIWVGNNGTVLNISYPLGALTVYDDSNVSLNFSGAAPTAIANVGTVATGGQGGTLWYALDAEIY